MMNLDEGQLRYLRGRLIQANDDAQAIVLMIRNADASHPIDDAAALHHAAAIEHITCELDKRLRLHQMPSAEEM